jgi:hypothetical protein
MWVCTSIAFPVDISYDAFNVDYRTIAQNGNGYFIQVKPGTHTDGSSLPDAENIIWNHASGVMNVVGKPAGVYEFIFVSTSDGFCGMANGEQSVVRVYLVPQLVGFPVLTNVCPGTTEEVDFNRFIPPEIRYFIDEVGWTITYLRNEKDTVKLPIEVGLSNVGDNVYRYTINDDAGPFKGKYKAMKDESPAAYFCPETSASLTHTVRIREGAEYAIPYKSISFCTDVLRLVPETRITLKTNLFGYLGSSAPNGKWSIEDPGGLNKSEFSIDEASGDVSIPVALITALSIDNIIFKYSYKNCIARDTFALLTFNFDKTTFTNTFTDRELPICRNLMSGVVELSSIFGFTAPLTSGIWLQKDGNEFKEMLYGAIDISEMKSGSLYTFRYNVSSAVDALCLVEGSSTEFQLRLQDATFANAEARICKAQFKDGVTIDLSRYVPGLNDADRIDPKKITWRNAAGAKIDNPHNYQLKASEDWQTADTSTYRMQYQYEVNTDCGPYTGNLYISTIDSVSVDTIRIVVCYTDDYAKHIDLHQILGIVGASGKFIQDVIPPGKKEKYEDVLDNIETTGIMNAFELFDINSGSETYTFRYLRGSVKDTCVMNETLITIVITKDVVKDTEVKEDKE